MSKIKTICIAVAIILVIGAFAKYYNERNHMEMAMETCGAKENIKHVDSKGFECIKLSQE